MKSYTITIEELENSYSMTRTNDGFTPIELLGILEFSQQEILKQMAGELKPEKIKRKVVVE